jgi:hypothetical protein
MSYLPIVSKSGGLQPLPTGEMFEGPLPTFYMNDFSIMGLRVSDCAATVNLLRRHRFAVGHRREKLGVDIRNAADVRQIIGLLAEHGLAAELADVAEQIYQG